MTVSLARRSRSTRRLGSACRAACEFLAVEKRVTVLILRHNSEAQIAPSGPKKARKPKRFSGYGSHVCRHKQRLLRKAMR